MDTKFLDHMFRFHPPYAPKLQMNKPSVAGKTGEVTCTLNRFPDEYGFTSYQFLLESTLDGLLSII